MKSQKTKEKTISLKSFTITTFEENNMKQEKKRLSFNNLNDKRAQSIKFTPNVLSFDDIRCWNNVSDKIIQSIQTEWPIPIIENKIGIYGPDPDYNDIQLTENFSEFAQYCFSDLNGNKFCPREILKSNTVESKKQLIQIKYKLVPIVEEIIVKDCNNSIYSYNTNIKPDKKLLTENEKKLKPVEIVTIPPKNMSMDLNDSENDLTYLEAFAEYFRGKASSTLINNDESQNELTVVELNTTPSQSKEKTEVNGNSRLLKNDYQKYPIYIDSPMPKKRIKEPFAQRETKHLNSNELQNESHNVGRGITIPIYNNCFVNQHCTDHQSNVKRKNRPYWAMPNKNEYKSNASQILSNLTSSTLCEDSKYSSNETIRIEPIIIDPEIIRRTPVKSIYYHYNETSKSIINSNEKYPANVQEVDKLKIESLARINKKPKNDPTYILHWLGCLNDNTRFSDYLKDNF